MSTFFILQCYQFKKLGGLFCKWKRRPLIERWNRCISNWSSKSSGLYKLGTVSLIILYERRIFNRISEYGFCWKWASAKIVAVHSLHRWQNSNSRREAWKELVQRRSYHRLQKWRLRFYTYGVRRIYYSKNGHKRYYLNIIGACDSIRICLLNSDLWNA